MAEAYTEEIYRIWDSGGHFYVEVSERDDVVHVTYGEPDKPQYQESVGILDSQIPRVIKALQRLLDKRIEENG